MLDLSKLKNKFESEFDESQEIKLELIEKKCKEFNKTISKRHLNDI